MSTVHFQKTKVKRSYSTLSSTSSKFLTKKCHAQKKKELNEYPERKKILGVLFSLFLSLISIQKMINL
jgi:hypothetical protein